MAQKPLSPVAKELLDLIAKFDGVKIGNPVEDEHVALADVPGVWDPLKHPHDPHTGKWVKKGHGVFGKKFHTAGHGHYTNTLGDTFAVHVPEGSKAFASPTGGSVVVVHPNGGHSVHTSKGVQHDKPIHAGLAESAHAGKLEELHLHKEDETPATEEKPKAGPKKVHVGKVVVDAGGKKVTLNKNQAAYKVASHGTLIATEGSPSTYISHVTGESHAITDSVTKANFNKHISDENLIAHGAGSPGPHPDKQDHPNVVGNALKHPVSGQIHELKPGDTLHQHKVVPTSFLILHGDKSGTKIDKNGKVSHQAPGNKQINEKIVKGNYKQIHEHTPVEAQQIHPTEEEQPKPEEPPPAKQSEALKAHVMAKATQAKAKFEELKAKAEAATSQIKEVAQKLKTVEVGGNQIPVESGDVIFQGSDGVIRAYHIDGTWSAWDIDGKITYSHKKIDSLEEFKQSSEKLKISQKEINTETGHVIEQPASKEEPKLEKKSITLGKTKIPLEPGDVVLQNQKDKSIIAVYHSDGTASQWSQGAQTHDHAEIKVATLASPSVVLATHPNWAKIDIATGKPEGYVKPAKGVKAADISHEGSPEKELHTTNDAETFAADTWKAVAGHFGSQYYSMGSTWNEADWQKRLSILGDEKFAAKMENAVATLKPVSKWSLDTISKSDKAGITKIRTRFELLGAASRLAQTIQGTDVTDEQIAEQLKLFEEKFGPNKATSTFGKWAPVDAPQLLAALKMGAQLRTFKNKTATLGFDPANGTHDDYQNYVATHGAEHAGGMTFDQAKLWTQMDLNEPVAMAQIKGTGMSPETIKSKLESLAHDAIIQAQVKQAAAKALQAHKDEEEVLKQLSSPKDSAIAAAQEAQQQTAITHTQYTGVMFQGDPSNANDIFELTKIGPDDWQFTYPGGETQDGVTDSQVINMLNDPASHLQSVKGTESHAETPSTEPDTYSSGQSDSQYQANLTAFKAQHGVTGPNFITLPSQLNSAIKVKQGNYVGKMDIPTKQQWLQWDLQGDELAKYSLEAVAAKKEKGSGIHKLVDSHPGSPDSPAGKKSWQALTDTVAQFGYPKPVSEWSDEQLNNFFASIYPSTIAKGMEKVPTNSKVILAEQWFAAHPHLSTPSKQSVTASGQKASTATEWITPTGIKIPLEPGDKVLYTSTGEITRAFHTDGTYSRWIEDGTQTTSHKKVSISYDSLVFTGDWQVINTSTAATPSTAPTEWVSSSGFKVPVEPSDQLVVDSSASHIFAFHKDSTYSLWVSGQKISDHSANGLHKNADSFIAANPDYKKVDLPTGPPPVEAPSPTAKQLTPKPTSVAQDVWDLASAAAIDSPTFNEHLNTLVGEKIAGMSEAEVQAHLQSTQSYGSALYGITTHEVSPLPLNAQKLLLWASQGSQVPYGQKGLPGIAENQKEKVAVIEVFKTKIAGGDFVPDSYSQWTSPSDKKVWHLSPGTGVYANPTSSAFLLKYPDHTGVYWTNNNPTPKTAPSYYLEDDTFSKLVFTAPDPLTYEGAVKDGKAFGEFDWSTVEQAEQTPPDQVKFPDPFSGDPETAKNYWQSSSPSWVDTGADAALYNSVKQGYDKLPQSVQKLATYSAHHGDKDVLGVIAYKLQKGHYGEDKTGSKIDPKSLYALPIKDGLTSADDIYYNWSSATVNEYIFDFGLTFDTSYPDSFQKAAAIAKHLADNPELLQPGDTGKDAPSTKAAELQLTKLNKSLGGMHSKTVWADQHGNEWMAKAFEHDPNGKARVDAEHWANQIGQLFGFRQPETRVMPNLGGNYSYVQHLAPADGDLTGMSPDDLSDEQLAQAMEEHVLDWLISNHDTHAGNLLRATGSDSLIGIDKGQAFKFFPNDQLAADYLPPGNGAPVWYDQFYKQLTSGQITKERADKITERVLRKAQAVQKRHDNRFREMVEAAVDKRTIWPSEHPNKKAFVDAVVARKAQIADDFAAFYEDLYKQSPHEWTIDPSTLTKHKITDDVFVGLHQELADAISQSAVHGKSLFFDSADLEDAHVLLYTEKGLGGEKVLKGEAKLRKDADTVVTKWLKQQSVEDKTGYGGSNSMSYPAVEEHAALPGNDHYYSQLVGYAKTVNHHANDGEYNQATVNSAKQAEQELKDELAAIQQWNEQHPTKVYNQKIQGGKFVTAEQQAAWEVMAQQYLGAFDQVGKAKDQGSTLKALFPDSVPYKQATYKPSKDIDTSGKPYVTEQADWQGEVAQKWSDGNYTLKTTDGVEKKLSPSEWVSWNSEHIATLTFPSKPGEEVKTGEAATWTSPKGKVYTQDGAKWTTPNGDSIEANAMASIVEQEEGWKFTPGTEGESEATVSGLGGKTLVVKKTHNSGTSGMFNQDSGELEHTSAAQLSDGYHGFKYEVHANDHVVEYRPWTEAGITTSQQGLLRFSVQDWKGTTEQLDDVLDTMRQMGVTLDQADEASLELYYWRHLRGILMDRADRKEAKYKKTLDYVSQHWTPGMAPDDELKVLKDAWALSMGKDTVDNADYLPHFSHTRLQSPDETSGKPYWLRPDYSLAQLHEVYGNKGPVHTLSDPSSVGKIVASGSFLPTEERLRVLGSWITGMSSSADQGHGSASFLFTRQNRPFNSNYQVHLHPRVALRTSNYSFSGDNFGELSNRKTGSYFDLTKASTHSGSGNELMIKNGVSVLDDLGALVIADSYGNPDVQGREEILARLKALGITEIHGIPIEEIFVLSHTEASKTMKKLWQLALAEEAKHKK